MARAKSRTSKGKGERSVHLFTLLRCICILPECRQYQRRVIDPLRYNIRCQLYLTFALRECVAAAVAINSGNHYRLGDFTEALQLLDCHLLLLYIHKFGVQDALIHMQRESLFSDRAPYNKTITVFYRWPWKFEKVAAWKAYGINGKWSYIWPNIWSSNHGPRTMISSKTDSKVVWIGRGEGN